MTSLRPKKITEEIIHQNKWWVYKHDKFIIADDLENDYFYGEVKGSVMCVPIMNDGRVALVVQNRYLRDKQSIEFSGGGILPDEQVLQAAQRELLEETGLEATDFSQIGTFDPYNGIFKDTTHVFLVKDVSTSATPKANTTEEVSVIFRRPDELADIILRREIWDGRTLAAWALVQNIINKK